MPCGGGLVEQLIFKLFCGRGALLPKGLSPTPHPPKPLLMLQAGQGLARSGAQALKTALFRQAHCLGMKMPEQQACPRENRFVKQTAEIMKNPGNNRDFFMPAKNGIEKCNSQGFGLASNEQPWLGRPRARDCWQAAKAPYLGYVRLLAGLATTFASLIGGHIHNKVF